MIDVLRDAAGKASREYLLGERFTAADVVIGSGLRWGMQFKTAPRAARVRRLHERLKARPALQRQIAQDEALATTDESAENRIFRLKVPSLRHRSRQRPFGILTTMLPDDVFRSRLQSTITALRYWAPSIADAARIEEAETEQLLEDHRHADAAERLPVRADPACRPALDLAIADETYENRPIESFDWFVPFADAIADGQVVQRHWISRLTGLERSVETLVTLPGGGIWREARGEPSPDAVARGRRDGAARAPLPAYRR